MVHELGHGAFNLRHTFPEVAQGTTDNLMDYSNGVALYKPQWDLIHNPEFTTDLWDGMEDGASIGSYKASHVIMDDCGDEPPLCPNYLTYLSPSGLPVSIPKKACQQTFSGELTSPDPNKAKIHISKNVLSSFRLDGDIYIAESDGTNFLGYDKLGINNKSDDPHYEDTYSVENRNGLKILLPGVDCFSGGTMQFESLNTFQGKYHAEGKLIKACQYCQKPDCGGECRLLCPKCLQPILKCYCGKACICYAERFLGTSTTSDKDCDLHRNLFGVGIPFWDAQGNLSIQKKSTGSDEQSILRNLILDSQGIRLFFLKLGQTPPSSPQEIIKNFATLTDYLEIIESGDVKVILNRFNQLYLAYSTGSAINEAMNNQVFLKAFYEAVKCVPAFGSVMGSIENLFSAMYSETLNTALLNRVKDDIDALGDCSTDYCNDERNKLEIIKSFAKNNLDRVKQQQVDDIHNRICTCPK